MRANIPESICVPGHPHYEVLSGIRDELIKRAQNAKIKIEKSIPILLREAMDDVMRTPQTGRRLYEDLEKTEKTYIGTRVEIEIRSLFYLPRGKLDVYINGLDVDIKFTIGNNWMMPLEVVDHPCFLVAADEVAARCYFGLFFADEALLTKGANRDQKRSVSADGFAHVMWLLKAHPLPPNFWRDIPADVANRIAAQPSGNKRVMALFREVQDFPIPRSVIDATARQKDFMRRVRADGGRGTRDLLRREGIVLLSGAYDSQLIEALGMKPISRDSFISHKLINMQECELVDRAKAARAPQWVAG